MHAGNRTVLFSYARVARVCHRSRAHVAPVVFNRYSSYEVGRVLWQTNCFFCQAVRRVTNGSEQRSVYPPRRYDEITKRLRPETFTNTDVLFITYLSTDAYATILFTPIRERWREKSSVSYKIRESSKQKKNLRFTRLKCVNNS